MPQFFPVYTRLLFSWHDLSDPVNGVIPPNETWVFKDIDLFVSNNLTDFITFEFLDISNPEQAIVVWWQNADPGHTGASQWTGTQAFEAGQEFQFRSSFAVDVRASGYKFAEVP